MDRAKLLARIDVAAQRGLEIGALTEPIVAKGMGRIEDVDRASTEELRRWYANQGHVDPSAKVEATSAEAAAHAAALERAAAAERQVDALRRSTSWRLTAPLRRAASAWRRFAGGGRDA